MSTVFKALADPTRRRVLQLLRESPMTAGELAGRFDVSKPTMSAHFAVLREADLIDATKKGTTITYRLKDLEEAWVETSQREVRYPSLPAGSYSFEVMARNTDGVWSAEPASLQFSILPPWWQSWWAYAAFLVAIAVGLRLVWGWRVAHLKRERLLLETAVQQRTSHYL